MSSNIWTFIELIENIKKFCFKISKHRTMTERKQGKTKQVKTKLSYLHGMMLKKKKQETSYRVPQVDSWLWWRSHCHNLPRHSHHINFQSLPYMSHHGCIPSLVWDHHCPEYLKNKQLATVLILYMHNEAENRFSNLETRGHDFKIIL